MHAVAERPAVVAGLRRRRATPSRIAISSTASTPSRKRIENENPKATAARRRPSRRARVSTSAQAGAHLDDRRRISSIGRRLSRSVAQLRELELGVEHQVRVAQAQRDLDVLVVVEVGGARELVGPLVVAGLRSRVATARSAGGRSRSRRGRARRRSASPRRCVLRASAAISVASAVSTSRRAITSGRRRPCRGRP